MLRKIDEEIWVAEQPLRYLGLSIVIMAHGSIIEQNGKEKFKQGYDRFLGKVVNVAA